jgi:uncharacterized membrane protein YhhN
LPPASALRTCHALPVREELVWVLPGAAALIDWYAVARGDRRTETIAKPLVLVSLIVVAVVLGAPDSTAGIWLLVALFFGLVGDIALLGDSVARFQAGLAAFLVGHLAFVVCFVELGLNTRWWSPFGLAALVIALVATSRVLPETHQASGPALSVPVAVYMAAIGAMLILAWCTGEPLVAAGATVFVASDAILSVNRFVRPVPHGRLLLMVAYHVGQALIVAGVLAV